MGDGGTGGAGGAASSVTIWQLYVVLAGGLQSMLMISWRFTMILMMSPPPSMQVSPGCTKGATAALARLASEQPTMR